jgi:uncharacterized damage-inducible protein DinB
MKSHFLQFADYNAWANRRIYGAVAALDEEQRNRSVGLFFGSLMGTLNHLLVSDRIWLGRLTGVDPDNGPLNKVLHADFAQLLDARLTQDARLRTTLRGYDEDAFGGEIRYHNLSGDPFAQPLTDVLAHLFNHQAHHRGQVHSGLSVVTGREPVSLDLLMFQRGFPAPTPDELHEAARG